MIVRLEHLFPADIERRIELSPILILPFGTIEWHSHHLPIGLDGIVAERMGEAMAEAVDGILAPVCYWAVGGVPFPWTLQLPLVEIESLLRATISQFSAMGFKYIVVFTGHFGLEQTLAVKRSALQVMQSTDAVVLPFTTYDLVADFYAGDHAGVGETSLMMATQPRLVRLTDWPSDAPLPGVIGEDDPRRFATPEFGQRIYEQSCVRLAKLITGFQDNKLDRNSWMPVLETIVDILETTRQMRMTMSRTAVPHLATEDYLRGCALIATSHLHEAQPHLHAKLAAIKAVHNSSVTRSIDGIENAGSIRGNAPSSVQIIRDAVT